MRAFVFFLFLVLCAIADAQPASPMGGMDLPVQPVRIPAQLQSMEWPYGQVPDTEDGDDPRDTPPPIFYGEEIETDTDSLIYVLDVSGSMALDGRLERARNEALRSISGLSRNFTFNVITYSTNVNVLWVERREASPPNKYEAGQWLLNWNAVGYTATGPAVAHALSDEENGVIVLLTDGLPNWGIPGNDNFANHLGVIEANNRHGASIHTFGIAVRGITRAFCQAVAAANNGFFTDVP